jgi:hypothetical protein
MTAWGREQILALPYLPVKDHLQPPQQLLVTQLADIHLDLIGWLFSSSPSSSQGSRKLAAQILCLILLPVTLRFNIP